MSNKVFNAEKHEARTLLLMKDHLTPRSRKLLEEFDSAAKCHGWHEDQGVGNAVIEAETDYLLAKRQLVNRLMALEERCAEYEKAERLCVQPSSRP